MNETPPPEGKTRAVVRNLASLGVPLHMIAIKLGISPRLLARDYPAELKAGAEQAATAKK